MKKTVKLICVDGNSVVHFNPKRVDLVAMLGNRIQVASGNFVINVKASWDEVRRFFRTRKSIEFVLVRNGANMLVNADKIIEWHEQDGGVFLDLGGVGYIVDGTLEEVTAKIEKALEEGAR